MSRFLQGAARQRGSSSHGWDGRHLPAGLLKDTAVRKPTQIMFTVSELLGTKLCGFTKHLAFYSCKRQGLQETAVLEVNAAAAA